jgi:hypothetical protein
MVDAVNVARQQVADDRTSEGKVAALVQAELRLARYDEASACAPPCDASRRDPRLYTPHTDDCPVVAMRRGGR